MPRVAILKPDQYRLQRAFCELPQKILLDAICGELDTYQIENHTFGVIL